MSQLPSEKAPGIPGGSDTTGGSASRALVGASASPNAVILKREFVILAQGMADPVFRQQNAAQVGMAGEPEAGEIVNLALVPVGGGPQASDRWGFRQLVRLVVPPARQHHFQGEAVPMR